MILSVVLERVLQQLFFSLLFSTRVNVIHIFFSWHNSACA